MWLRVVERVGGGLHQGPKGVRGLGPGKGQAGKAEGVGGGRGASAHVLGGRETMRPLVIAQDPPPASQCVPSAGWIPVAAWGRGWGPSMGPLFQRWVWARLPGHTVPSPGLAGLRGFHPLLAEDRPCG